MSHQEQATTAAREILEMLRSTYVPTHEYQTVELKQLDDCEDMSFAKAKGNMFKRVPVRSMVSNDGVIMAGLYHVKVSAIWLRVLLFILRKKVGKTIDMESEFQDGSFVCTSNAEMAGAMKLPPMIHSELHPVATSCAVLLRRHRDRVQQHIKDYSVSPVIVRTTAEVRESQNRMNALKAAFRGELGEVSLEELEKLSFSKTQAREVYDAAQKIRQEQ